MKTLLAAIFIICVGIVTSYAGGGFLLLHVGDANGNGGGGSACTISADFTSGCPKPFLGGM